MLIFMVLIWTSLFFVQPHKLDIWQNFFFAETKFIMHFFLLLENQDFKKIV